MERLEWAIADWVLTTLVVQEDEPITLDGKAVPEAHTDKHPAPHLLSFCTHASQENLLQVRVDKKTNEIPVLHAK